jgi:hypothetical protein
VWTSSGRRATHSRARGQGVVGVSALGCGAACGSRIFGAVHPRTCWNRREVCSRSKRC